MINSPLSRRCRGRRAARVVDDAAAAGASRVAGRWIAGGLTDATASRPSGPLRIPRRLVAPAQSCQPGGGRASARAGMVRRRRRRWNANRTAERRLPRFDDRPKAE